METTERETFQVKGTRGKLEPVKASEILNAIAEGKNINVEYAVIKGDLDIDSIADLLKQDKKGKLIIQGNVLIQFSEVKGSARFEKATFGGDTNFMATTFSGSASFKKATFSGSVSFRGATFSRYAYFGEATFSGSVSFWEATFSTCSGSASLGKFANFEKATFSGKVDFSRATFSGNVSFREATFEVNADFDETRMKYPANFAGVNYNENTLSVGFRNNIIRPFLRHLTFDRIVLSEKPITDFSLVNTTTIMDGSSNPYLKRYIDDEQWITSWKSRGKMQRFLFILWELTCHCGRSIRLWGSWSGIIALLFGLAYAHQRWIVFGLLGLPALLGSICCFKVNVRKKYAPEVRKPRIKKTFRCCWILLLTGLVISMIYVIAWSTLTLSFEIAGKDRTANIITYLYFSVVTFTTLGFGDVIPLCNQSEIWLMVEVILGYIMLGGLISIFANKLARRS